MLSSCSNVLSCPSFSSSPHRLPAPRFPPRRKILLGLRASVFRLQVNDVIVFPLRAARGVNVAEARDFLSETDVVIRLKSFGSHNMIMRAPVVVTDVLDVSTTETRLMAFICTTLFAAEHHACETSMGSCCASCPPIWPFEGVGPGAAPPPFGFGAAAWACACANIRAVIIMAFEISERSRSL